MADFRRFLSTAHKYATLITDLCAEPDVISRARMFNYLEQHHIPPAEKTRVIDDLCQAAVLFIETEQDYAINPVVVDLVNYYERRGRLTSAAFLRDQILAIAKLTDALQQQIVAEEKQPEPMLDTLDDLYRLVREVREAGDGHYLACMRLFGDMKRTGDARSVEQRIMELQTAQRRHITPLRELIDPDAEYVHRIQTLHRRMAELSAMPLLLVQSQELESRRRRLLMDLRYIDHVLLHNFATIERTALTLLQSLLDEKRIKDAVATCLGNLEATWAALNETTVLPVGRQVTQAPVLDTLAAFFVDVIHQRLTPDLRPLTSPEAPADGVESALIHDAQIWQRIQQAREIASWPAFVVEQFAPYPGKEQLRVITLPLTARHGQVQIALGDTPFEHTFATFRVQMRDFGLKWSIDDDHAHLTQEPGHLSEAPARLSI